ncbi:tRNA guanosine(34) transglycosylase Tgt [Balneolales bacterium ANBcel1]|nr:tRNA guanosine(34) transglycosylase Tgt [Balneolales bacterium ANBcel1]
MISFAFSKITQVVFDAGGISTAVLLARITGYRRKSLRVVASNLYIGYFNSLITVQYNVFHLRKETSKGKARLGSITTDHGVIPTPIFMPVGTLGTVKAIDSESLTNKVKAPVILGNTYHLYLRPGNEIMGRSGGLHRFMNWPGALLTDSGGYQVFSLSDIRNIEEDGVVFKSHLDGSRHKFTPANVIETQRILGSDIMMVLDECPPYPATESYVRQSLDLTHRWARECFEAFTQSSPRYGHRQFLFGITQGGVYPELRKQSIETLAATDFDGLAIGGLSVGEPPEMMYEITGWSTEFMPKDKPRYLMGVGTPADLLESVARGIDMFDCVMPTRNARNGMLFTRNGIINIKNKRWKTYFEPADPGFGSDLCQLHTMAYVHHLFRAGEVLGIQLATAHNLTFYLWLMEQIRSHIEDDTYADWYPGMVEQVRRRL